MKVGNVWKVAMPAALIALVAMILDTEFSGETGSLTIGAVGTVITDVESRDAVSRDVVRGRGARGLPAVSPGGDSHAPKGSGSGSPRVSQRLSRDPSVIEAKVEKKRRKILENRKKPQHPGELDQERYRQRAGASGKIPVGGLVRAKEHVDAMREARRRATEDQTDQGDGDTGHDPEGPWKDAGIWSWEWLGPGNVGGRVRTILTHPNNDAILWIGSASGGIWKTTDGGGSWSPVDDFMANLAVTSLAMDPMDRDILYAATGEGFGNGDALPGAGIFRSTDGGDTWSQLPATDNEDFVFVNRLAVDPTQGDVLYAATGHATDPTVGALWMTTDGGASWDSLLTTQGRATDVKVNPVAPQRILVGTNSDLFLSLDGGETWDQKSTGGPGELPSGKRCEGAFASNTTDIYVSAEGTNGALFRSSNGGGIWTFVNNNYLGPNGWYNNAIWVHPLDPEFVIVGGIDLFRSTDGGVNLTKISTWQDYHNPGTSPHADQHIIVPTIGFPFNKQVYIGNDGGIQRADDITTATSNSGWVNLANGLGITQFYSGAASPDGSVIVGGSQDNDQLRFVEGSGTNGWYQAKTGDGCVTAVKPDDPDVIFASSPRLYIWRSINRGGTYTPAISGLGDVGNALFIAPFRMDPNFTNALLAGGQSLWWTGTQGVTWTNVRGPLASGSFCSAIDIGGSPSNVWVGYVDGTVSKSTSLSIWTDVDDNGIGLPDRWVTDIVVNPSDVDEVFVTFVGYEPDNVWYTSDGGASWQNRSGTPPFDLPALQVNTVTLHPADPGWVYIGTDLGVFASEDRGVTWNATPRYSDNEGPANVEVDDLFFYGDEWLVAATHGRGMYRSRPLPVAYVDGSAVTGGGGSATDPFRTAAEAEEARGHGTPVFIEAGTYGESPLSLTKRGRLTATNGVVRIE